MSHIALSIWMTGACVVAGVPYISPSALRATRSWIPTLSHAISSPAAASNRSLASCQLGWAARGSCNDMISLRAAATGTAPRLTAAH
jgi:hypothetical protein